MAASGAMTGADYQEIVQIADTVAREKGIERETVIEAMEQAIQHAGKRKYGPELDIRAEIDRASGAVTLRRFVEVVEDEAVEVHGVQIGLEEARAQNPIAQVGDFIATELPPVEFGRIAVQTAKQVIVQKVREAERERQYNEYKDRVGEIVIGYVKNREHGNLIVDLGKAEALLRRDECVPGEFTFDESREDRSEKRVRAYIYSVRQEPRGPQIFLSRTHPQFMVRLFAQEVPEIYDGIIEIKAVARDPGSRAKIAVMSNDSSIDPVGACVGMRGSRVQAVVNELNNEKIDIIPWSPDIPTCVVNALQPAEVAKVVMDEEERRMEVVVPDDQLSLAIGRRGQNVRLASQLVGWDIDIMTESDESERRIEEMRQKSEHFMDALDVDDVLARLLVTEGFSEADEVAYVPVEELLAIEGLDETVAHELQNRALAFVEERDRQMDQRRRELGVEDAVADIEGLTPTMLAALGEKEIRTLDDLGDLAADELMEEILPGYLAIEDANAIVMAARAHWFADEDEAESTENAAAGGEDGGENTGEEQPSAQKAAAGEAAP